MNRRLLLTLPAIPVSQPIGTFYITSMKSDVLASIAKADVRRLESSLTAIEQYLGIQRKLDPKRRKEIGQFVRTVDATFPTSVVIAVEDDRCLEYDEHTGILRFYEIADENGTRVDSDTIATILDGQHRLAGLQEGGEVFELSVTVFPGIDVADQAYIFATVNIAQTKVNTSLAYDLLAYSRSRSPERTCHDIAVALNAADGSPLFHRIKRLGSATPGIEGETITQATLVQSLLPYITRDRVRDRDDLRRGIPLPLMRTEAEIKQTPFRNLFISERDSVITNILWEYFDSIRNHWPLAWASDEKGQIIKRTNGFRSFMNVLGRVYLMLKGSDRFQPSAADYERIWECSTLEDSQFNTNIYLPGGQGEKRLTNALESALRVFATKHSASIKH